MNVKKNVSALLLAVVVLLQVSTPTAAAVQADLQPAVEKTVQTVLKTVAEPKIGTIGGEWAVLGLARSGISVPQSYWEGYYDAVEKEVKAKKGVLHEKKYTEYARVALALTALGADPTDVGGYNLLKPLGDFDKTVWQGINGPIWALIALDAGRYDMPVNKEAKVQATRQMYVDEILARQLSDGGWTLVGTEADPDLTGMALQALSKYRSQKTVEQAVEKGLSCLSQMQTPQGGFENGTCESVVQVIVALGELGISPEDSRFIKNGTTLLDALDTFRQKDGRFLHIENGAVNQMATEQGLYAMVSLLRAAEGKSSLYTMDDVQIVLGQNQQSEEGSANKHKDVKKSSVVHPGKTFADIAGHSNQSAIEALAQRGIIDGKTAETFDPDAQLTRAEFTAIVVRALGLTPRSVTLFSDVKNGSWYAGYVGAAYEYGIVKGVGADRFQPQGTITRQEACVMVTRAAKLCGMDTAMQDSQIDGIVSRLQDSGAVAPWAREGVAFCVSADILAQSGGRIAPVRPILRSEIAQMLYQMLGAAELL